MARRLAAMTSTKRVGFRKSHDHRPLILPLNKVTSGSPSAGRRRTDSKSMVTTLVGRIGSLLFIALESQLKRGKRARFGITATVERSNDRMVEPTTIPDGSKAWSTTTTINTQPPEQRMKNHNTTTGNTIDARRHGVAHTSIAQEIEMDR